MKKSLVVALVVFVGSVGIATRAHGAASAAKVTVTNNTDRCVWLTYYTSVPAMPWIAAAANWVKPRGAQDVKRFTFFAPQASPVPAPVPGQVKVRAEFMTNAACDHPVKLDTYAQKGLLLTGKEEWSFELKMTTTNPVRYSIEAH
jgi:hypothetical protein